ncbi:MAG: TIGR00730 family Rossman fold protein [Chromatiales bacterium]|nr:TIGR00730 family Rossman fold protein [Chromatiales bacterium]
MSVESNARDAHGRAACVFCGSRLGADPAYAACASRLGALLAERGIRLVYGGGGVGLMDTVASATLAAGGEVTGVIPQFLERREVGKVGLTEMVVVDSMHERKRRMFERADGFVILPGGVGTLDEAFEIVSWRQLRLHDKPIVLLDVGGYWAPFVALLDGIIDGGFAPAETRDLVHVATSPEAAVEVLERAPITPRVPTPVERL